MQHRCLIFVGIAVTLWAAGCASDRPALEKGTAAPPQNGPAGTTAAVSPAPVHDRPDDFATQAGKKPPVDSEGKAKPPRAKTVRTASGLEYEDVVVGKGPMPKRGQNVTVDYIGTLNDGTEFDSSFRRDQPFTFALGQGQVIKGWDEGIATMRVGGQRFLTIPPALAYGPAGQPPKIPPHSTLTFLVTLQKIN